MNLTCKHCRARVSEGQKVCHICGHDLDDVVVAKQYMGNSHVEQRERTEMEKYLAEKLKVLKQLRVKVSDTQLEYMRSLKTEFALNAFAHDLILGRPRVL